MTNHTLFFYAFFCFRNYNFDSLFTLKFFSWIILKHPWLITCSRSFYNHIRMPRKKSFQLFSLLTIYPLIFFMLKSDKIYNYNFVIATQSVDNRSYFHELKRARKFYFHQFLHFIVIQNCEHIRFAFTADQ